MIRLDKIARSEGLECELCKFPSSVLLAVHYCIQCNLSNAALTRLEYSFGSFRHYAHNTVKFYIDNDVEITILMGRLVFDGVQPTSSDS